MKGFFATLLGISFLALICTVGALENGYIATMQGDIRIAISFGVMCVSIYALNRLGK